MPKATRMRETGGPEVLRWEDEDAGVPGPGEAPIRHDAVGVNFIDVYHRGGLYPLSEASGSHRDLEGCKTSGSTILIPGE
jgi:NADPH2:quinone reductase